MFTRLQSRLTLIFVILAVVPLLTVSIIITIRTSASLERTALASLDQAAQRVAVEASAFINARVDELVLSATMNDLQSPEERDELEILLFRTNLYQKIALMSPRGEELANFSRNVDENEAHFEVIESVTNAALASGEMEFSDVYFDDTVREPLMSVAFPVLDVRTGETAYVLSALFSFRPVWDLVRVSDLGEEVEAYILAPNAQVIAHRDPAVVLSERVVALPSASGETETVEGEVFFAQRPLQLGERTLSVVAQQPVAQALALQQENQRLVSLLTLGALLLAAALVAVVVSQVVRPIVRLAAVAQQIREGDLSARAESAGKDEVGQLGVSFNAMAGQLAAMVGSLEQQVAERTLALGAALQEVEERAALQAELLEQVARQREDILALSVPLLPIDRRTLVMPLVGAFDGQRLSQVQERALEAIQASSARRLILDVTGTPLIDTQVARGLLDVSSAARLLGTEVQLVGVRPEVAQTIVGLGLDFTGLRVFSTLEAALAARAELPVSPVQATAR